MTKKEFNNLKIGDRILLPNTGNLKGTFTSTEVLSIDRFFSKISVLLKNRPLSYKYLQLKSNKPINCYVGVCKQTF